MKSVNYQTQLYFLLKEKMQDYNRIAVTGWPNVGKTTAISQLKDNEHKIIHSDLYIEGGFKQDWNPLIKIINTYDKFIIEGVGVSYMLEQGLLADYIVLVKSSYNPSFEHKGMAKAVETILNRTRLEYDVCINDIIKIG